jgi:hypothetical protein
MKLGLCGALCALGLALTTLVACGDDTNNGAGGNGSTSSSGTGGAGGDGGTGGAGGNGGAGGQGGGQVALGDIEVTVAYTGAKTGPVAIAAFTNFPPMGPPLAVTAEPMPKFPLKATLTGLEAGTYYVIAFLDAPPASGNSPGKEDPQAVSMPAVQVKGNDKPTVTLTLMEMP